MIETRRDTWQVVIGWAAVDYSVGSNAARLRASRNSLAADAEIVQMWATMFAVFGRPNRKRAFRYYDQFATVLGIAFAAAVLIAAVMWSLAQS